MTLRQSTGSADDARLLREVLAVVGSIDGQLDAVEQTLIEALSHTIPQLREQPLGATQRPQRAQLLQELAKLNDEKLRRQCFILAVELAIAGGVNESEDQYLEHIRSALRIDDQFARQVIEVLACKYARSRS